MASSKPKEPGFWFRQRPSHGMTFTWSCGRITRMGFMTCSAKQEWMEPSLTAMRIGRKCSITISIFTSNRWLGRFSRFITRINIWRGLLTQVEFDRNDLSLWVRKPCINDPKTDEYVREHVTRYVRMHRAFRPLFYNIADELGQGDQIRPNDFCHAPHCTIKFAEYL